MANETQLSLQSLQLSAGELVGLTKASGAQWPKRLINDYLTTFRDLSNIAIQIDDVIGQVDTNTENIATNTANIQANADNLQTHEDDTSAHGVTGNNVGTEDYAQLAIGGVVLLAALVSDAIDSTATIDTADVGDAPATYLQTYAQEQTDLINETKAAHNQLVTDLNSSIAVINSTLAAMIAAKQMADS